ncbi:ABC transporter permease [Gluconacetobacter liquefaciens]|uniref:FtsX-like permease family protein n=1 Tax=Gluconacetobacter liquefaciens TaxID=89584 RepID=A0A370G5Q7_GLULI|nr:ABC transporter permease [Gluconacetobacter liquefaciens]MBB2187589.1 FtsX-like permease family protein [Gluconacetobacter liquefaciens]RDI37373.1 putative ABC transport system permease protein [Gluconacetobacter liquefaciens]GEB38653.1 ABC transporter permease [Gluconacetobacter liquefaciens]
MFATILKSVLRQMRRHPLYVGLNMFGLALGVGVFLTLTLLVRYEYSFNAALPDVDRLVRVDTHWTMPGTPPGEVAGSTFRALPFLREDFPEIEAGTRFENTELQTEQDGVFSSFVSGLTDPAFFSVFGLKLLHGAPDQALAQPDGLVLSDHAAIRLFGTTEVMGRTVRLNRNGVTVTHTVTGVLARRTTPDLFSGIEMMAPFSSEDMTTRFCFLSWGSDCGRIYLKFRRAGDIDAVSARLRDFVMRHAAGADSDSHALGTHPEKIFGLLLAKLGEARFRDFHVLYAEDGVDRTVINSIGLMGLLALALACANAVNLATARAGLRAREVAIRKTLGASRRTLLVQFMGEAVLVAFIAGVLGLALCELLVPEVASLTGEALVVRYGLVGVVLPLIILVCGFACGIYPSLILSGYRPAAVLAAARMPSGGRGAARLRDALVTGQFGIAITIVICMLVINHQTVFMRTADPGYVRSGLLIGSAMPGHDLAAQRKMLDALRAVPGVITAGFGELAPRPDTKNLGTYSYDRPAGPVSVYLLQDVVSVSYFEVYRPRLLAGRWFDAAHGQDDLPPRDEAPTRKANVVLNAGAVSRFGFAAPDQAIGKIIKSGGMTARIIGVIDDMRFESPRQAIYPEIIFFNTLANQPFNDPIPAVRFQGIVEADMVRRLNRAWAGILPDASSDFSAVDARMSAYYSGDERRGRIFTLGAAAALLIACLGLYGLAAFAAARRVHEIGIRKTLGATGRQIVALLLGDFLRPVALSCVLACPVAWVVMRRWLAGFDERITLTPAHFLIAVAGAFAIAILTVLGQTFHLARAEPARALRAE